MIRVGSRGESRVGQEGWSKEEEKEKEMREEEEGEISPSKSNS